ncbi:acetate kinase [bacterium]|nr:acetate kinase [candidate division CSSED10-310 bacterium]
MKILVINAGSSSIKFQVFEMETERVLCKGRVENIGSHKIGKVLLRCKQKGKYEEKQHMEDHRQALMKILQVITSDRFEILESIDEIRAVGHRVVHGGEHFTGSCIVNAEMIDAMEACIDLAPLHNPPNILGIKVCHDILPGIPQVGVFDTAFHQTMEPDAYLYGLPYELYEKYKIRRFGFHGTSHMFCCQEAARLLNRSLEELKIITCHLGNGASVAAIRYGRSIDTSMGFTPLEGLVMGTRCGDLDPAIVPFLMEKEKLDFEGVSRLLNHESGMLGLAGIDSYDMRDILKAAEEGNMRAALSIRLYCLRLRKYIGAYIAELGGVDAIVFTGGVGENNPSIREGTLKNMEFLGINLDPHRNETLENELISNGRVAVMVIATNEELVIAREAHRLVGETLTK